MRQLWPIFGVVAAVLLEWTYGPPLSLIAPRSDSYFISAPISPLEGVIAVR